MNQIHRNLKCQGCGKFYDSFHLVARDFHNACIVKGKNMKAPQAQKGTAGIPKRPSAPTSTSNPAIKQIGPTLFHVQGSANKPYVVDLEASDIRSTGKTAKCTCTNWATVRNRMVGADPLNNFTGYSCKHIAEVLRTVGSGGGVPNRVQDAKAKAASDAKAKKLKDKVLADFLR